MRGPSHWPFEALFFFLASNCAVLFLESSLGFCAQTRALFAWLLAFLAFLFSFGRQGGEERQNIREMLWLLPRHSWQILMRDVGGYVLSCGVPFGLLLGALGVLHGLSLRLLGGLVLGFFFALPSWIFLGVLMEEVVEGSERGALLTPCLLLPLCLPSLLMGWTVVEGCGRGEIPWPCLVGLMGLWCLQGVLTLFLGSWALRQRLLA